MEQERQRDTVCMCRPSGNLPQHREKILLQTDKMLSFPYHKGDSFPQNAVECAEIRSVLGSWNRQALWNVQHIIKL